jgi:hypothetical protein
MQGRIEYCDPRVADSDDDNGDTLAPAYYDLHSFQGWLSRDREWARQGFVDVLIGSLGWCMKISWLELAKTVGLRADARVLLQAMALTDDEREIRSALGWNYSRYEKARKKLRRKYPKLAQLILIGIKLLRTKFPMKSITCG